MNFSCIAVAFTSLYIVRHNPNPQSFSNKLSKINSRKLYIYKILPPPLLLSHHRPYIRQKFRKNFHQKISRPSNIWCSLSKTRRKERERERDNRTPKGWFEKFSLSFSLSFSKKIDRISSKWARSRCRTSERKRRLPRSLGNLT